MSCVLSMLVSCATKPTKPEVSPAPLPPVVEVPEPVADVPEVIEKKELLRQYYRKKAELISKVTDDANLKNWLEVRLLSIDLAERRIDELRTKEERTPQENRELAEVEAALEEESRELEEGISLSYRQYRVNFVISGKSSLSGRPLEDLQGIKQDIIASCQGRRDVQVLGWGCARGGEEATLEVSDQRAKNVAGWIKGLDKCGNIARFGMGVYTKDVPGLADDVLENLRSKHRVADILVRRESMLPPTPVMEEDALPGGGWEDEGRTYFNAELGFRISLPHNGEGWYLVPDPEAFHGVSVVLVGPGTQVQVLVHPLSGLPITEDVLESMGQRLGGPKKDRVIGYKEIKSNLIRRASGDYYELQYQGTVGSGQMRFCERLFLHGRNMITVVAMATPERWKLEEAMILETLNSMTLK
jgi:hypothetical protein